MSSSPTSTTSSTRLRISGSVSAPGALTPMPSAIVACAQARSPPCTEFHAAGKRSVWTPTIWMSGRSARAAVAMPLISPPPPIATTSVSIDGCCSSISSPIVPWPAITARSSYGCTTVSARSLRELEPARARVLEGVAVEHDLGAEAARALDLDRRREARHHDRRRDAHALGVVRDRLRVVAGRDREHAVRALVGGELRHLVERAALLERRRELQVLELEEDVAAGELGQRARRQARRARDLAGEAPGGRADVVDGQRRSHRATAASAADPADLQHVGAARVAHRLAAGDRIGVARLQHAAARPAAPRPRASASSRSAKLGISSGRTLR